MSDGRTVEMVDTAVATEPVAPAGDARPAATERRGRRGKGHLYRRDGSAYWWMAVSYRGRLIRASTGETDKKKAMERLRAKLNELAAARGGYTTIAGPEVRQVTVRALLERLVQDYELRGVRSLAQVKSHKKHVEEGIGDWHAAGLTADDIDRYITARLKAEAAPATANRETQLLGQALRPFLEKARLSVPRIRRLAEDNVREGFYERAEFEAVLAALPDDLRDFCRFGYLVGWRKGEIASLLWADVDREGRVIRLSWRSSKNKRPRKMALEGALWEIIERRWAARQVPAPDGSVALCPLVFHRDGRRIKEFRKSWASACKAAGVAGRLFHDFRRTAVRNMVRAGVDPAVAMKISGHRTRAMFDRYDITADEDIRESILKVDTYVNGLPTEARVLPLKAAVATVPERGRASGRR